jgi:hypothetical protein
MLQHVAREVGRDYFEVNIEPRAIPCRSDVSIMPISALARFPAPAAPPLVPPELSCVSRKSRPAQRIEPPTHHGLQGVIKVAVEERAREATAGPAR